MDARDTHGQVTCLEAATAAAAAPGHAAAAPGPACAAAWRVCAAAAACELESAAGACEGVLRRLCRDWGDVRAGEAMGA